MNIFVDIHSHDGGVEDRNVISHPTLSVTDERIFDFAKPFWCGLHPCEKMDVETLLERLNKVKERLVGVGEIGLDALCDVEGQSERFEVQLDFARANALPVTIHAVKTYNEIVETLRRKGGEKVVIHSFISHPVVASHLLDAGCFLSFGAGSLRSHKSVDALRRIPLERLLLETDSKGTIQEIYHQVAEIKKIDIEILKQQIYDNYKWLIG